MYVHATLSGPMYLDTSPLSRRSSISPAPQDTFLQRLLEETHSHSYLMDGPVTAMVPFSAKGAQYMVLGLGCGVAVLVRIDSHPIKENEEEKVYMRERNVSGEDRMEGSKPIVLPGGASLHGSVQEIVVADVDGNGYDDIVSLPFFAQPTVTPIDAYLLLMT